MSTEFYTKMGDKAGTLIKKYGRKVQLRRRPYGELQDRDCWVVRTQFDPRVFYGELVSMTDHRYLMAPDVNPPPDSKQDRLVVDGAELSIVTAPPLKPADVVLLYDVQARL